MNKQAVSAEKWKFQNFSYEHIEPSPVILQPIQRTEQIYDTANRLTDQSWIIGSNSFTEYYEYNDPGDSSKPLNDGSLFSVTTATNDTQIYNYDALKRIGTVTTTNAGNTGDGSMCCID